MKNYYYDQSTKNLVCFDDQDQAIAVLTRIQKVRVFVNSEMQIGDFNGDEERGSPPPRGKGKGGKRTITCSKCKASGHQARTCPG